MDYQPSGIERRNIIAIHWTPMDFPTLATILMLAVNEYIVLRPVWHNASP
jgi:hypothetical protein